MTDNQKELTKQQFEKTAADNQNRKLSEIYLAGGCFWGTQHYFDCLAGVVNTEVGYANGRTANPTYEQVKHENTGHAETVKILYDANLLPLEDLLEQFYKIIDPTSVNRQGGGCGSSVPHRYLLHRSVTEKTDRKLSLLASETLYGKDCGGGSSAVEFLHSRGIPPEISGEKSGRILSHSSGDV